RFSKVFLEILKKNCILKGIITEEDWDSWKNDIIVNFVRDNYFAELKESEILRERITTLESMQNAELVGTYFSKEWVMKNILKLDDEDVKKMQAQISGEGGNNEPTDQQEESKEEEFLEDIVVESEVDEESKILENKVKEKELQVLENVAQALATS
ncbi:MAG TPA: hypothetical protein DCM40_05290, partial [Maribacter sp.]|nr:hypothetical protein [Maribacter sp.]